MLIATQPTLEANWVRMSTTFDKHSLELMYAREILSPSTSATKSPVLRKELLCIGKCETLKE